MERLGRHQPLRGCHVPRGQLGQTGAGSGDVLSVFRASICAASIHFPQCCSSKLEQVLDYPLHLESLKWLPISLRINSNSPCDIKGPLLVLEPTSHHSGWALGPSLPIIHLLPDFLKPLATWEPICCSLSPRELCFSSFSWYSLPCFSDFVIVWKPPGQPCNLFLPITGSSPHDFTPWFCVTHL